MSTINYLSALESLDSSTSNNDAILVDIDNDSDDLIHLWRHGRRRRRSCRRPTTDADGGSNINFNMNNILMLPPPPPLSSRSHYHLTANARASNPIDDIHMDNMMMMDLAATMRSSVATTHNIPLDAHNLRRWHGYNVDDEHTTDGNTGHLTTTTTLPSTSSTAAIAATATATATAGVTNGGGIFASPTPTSPPSSSSSALVPYTTYTPSRTMGRIGEQRLVRSLYYDNSNHHQRHQQYHPLYHRLWQQPQYHHHQHDMPLPPQLEQRRRQMEQLLAVSTHAAVASEAEELAVLDAAAAAVAAEDEGLERLRRILTSIHRGNNNNRNRSSSSSAQLNVYNGTTATLPSLGMDTIEYLAMGGVDASATDVAGGQNHGVAEETVREENGTINSTLSSSTITAGGVSSDTYQDNSNASTLPIQEEITTSSATDEENSSSAQATTTTTTTTTTTATVTNNDITTDVASVATAPPSPRIGRPVRQAAMRGMERISAAIATHGMGEGATATLRTTTLTTRLCARSTSSLGGRKKRKKKATIIPRPGTTPTTNDDGSTSPFPSSAEKVAASSPICCICMDEPSHEELSSIDACKHPFCFSCIEQWADQENTCPLCKARFHKIDRVNPITSKRKNMDGERGGKGEPLECNRDEERSSKRVRNRDQRSDVHSYSSLEGIFGALEANGTWPTHIAQLLFSGLGASSLGASSLVNDLSGGLGHSSLPAGNGLRATRRFMTAASTTHGHSYQSHAAAATGNDMVDLAHWYEPTGARRDDGASSFPGRSTFGHGRGQYHREGMRSSPATSPSNSTTTTTRTRGGIVDLGARGIAHPSSPAWRHSFPTGRGASTFSATATSTAATPPTHRNPFTSFETPSPWSASASVSVTLGPGGFEGESSSTRTTAYQHSTAPAASATDTWGNNPFLTGEEEEEMLSTMSALSPSSYICRLHRELELGNGMHSQRQDRLGRQYQVNSSRRPSSSADVTSSTTSGSTPLSMYFDRLRRESERDSQWQDRLRRQYQANASGRGTTTAHPCPAAASAAGANFTTATMEPTFTGNTFNSLSATNFGVGASSDFVHRNRNSNMNPWNNSSVYDGAGRTVLEIDDSDDDDVVEIIDVEALP